MARPLILENQTLVRGLRRDAVGDERFSSFHTLENYDVVYDPTVSLRRRKRFIKHSLLTNDTSTSPVDWLYATYLNNRYVIFTVREDGKITRSVLNATEQSYSFLPRAGVVNQDDVILLSQSDFDSVNLNDALLYSMPSGGTSLSGLADKNTYIVQALGTIDNALGIRLAATPLSTTYLNLTQHTSEGNLHTLTTAPYYSVVHDLNVATSANLWKESAYYNDIRVRFLTVGKRVFIQTYAGDQSLNKEHGLYFITENMTAAAPVNPEYSGDELIDIHGSSIYVNGKAENTSVTDDRADGFHSVIKSFDYTPDEIEFDGGALSTASDVLEGMHQIHTGTPLFIHRVGESDSDPAGNFGNTLGKIRELSTNDPEAYRLTLGMDMDANRAVSSNTLPVGWVSQRFSIEWMGINAGDGTDIASANTVDSWEPNPDFPAAYIFDKVMIAMTVNDVNTATHVGQNSTATDPYDDVFKKEKVPGNFKLYITKDKLNGHIGQGIPDWDNVIAESPWMSSNHLGQCTTELGGIDAQDLLHSSKVGSVLSNNQDALTNVAGDVAAPQSIRATAQDEENGMWHISSWVDNTDEIGTGALYLEGMDSTAPDLNTGRVQYYNLVITADKDYFDFVRNANNFDPPAIDNSQTKRDQRSLKMGAQIWCERASIWKSTQAKMAKESINEDGQGLIKDLLTPSQKLRNCVKVAPYVEATHPYTKPTDAAWEVSDDGNVEGVTDQFPATNQGEGLIMGFMVGQPEWWVSNSTIYSRFRNYTTPNQTILTGNETVYDGNHDNLNYGISYANPDIPHETELPLVTEALSARTSSRPIQAWTAYHGPGHASGTAPTLYKYPNYDGNDQSRNIINLKPDHKTGNFPHTSLGYDFASHYRIYRQRTQSDSSWEWVQDIPISLARNRSIAVVLSHIWQGLSDPNIYLPNDEDDKAYAPEHMEVWAERLWLAVGNKLRFSARAEESTRYGVTGTPIYESVPISNVIEFDENITALSVFGDRLVVFFKNHTRILSGALSMLNPPPDLVVSDIVNDEGTTRPDSVIPFRGSVSFINQFGQVRMFSGQEVTSDISDPNQSIWNSFGADRVVFSTVYDDQLIIGIDTTTVPDKRAEELHILDLRKMQLPVWKVYKLTSGLTNLQVRHDNRLIGAIDGSSWIKGLIELDGYSNTEFSAALSGSTSSTPIKIQPTDDNGSALFTYVRPYAEINRPVVGDTVVVERSDTISYNGTRYISAISASGNDDVVLLSTNPNDLNGSILPYAGTQGYDYGRIVFTHATIEPELTSKATTHFVSPGTVGRWKKFDLDGYYYDEQSGTVTIPSAITVTAIAKDGKKSSNTIRPKNANDSRNHSGGLRIRSEECQLQIESTGKYTDAIRRIEFS